MSIDIEAQWLAELKAPAKVSRITICGNPYLLVTTEPTANPVDHDATIRAALEFTRDHTDSRSLHAACVEAIKQLGDSA